ncbi:MAG: proton-conducting transporter membrane subunit [Desulfosarcinaceae bacterium]|nr:proton-conducting transporter membrane subunit [Desulfosarcinaceae bacterium]
MTSAQSSTVGGPLRYLHLLPSLLIFTLLAALVPHSVRGTVFGGEWIWSHGLGVHLAWRLDGLSMLFGLIISGAGVLVTLYSLSYLAGHPHENRYFLLLHSFLLAMLGIVLADHLLLLFIFWELTTVLSFLLIGFYHEEDSARENARQALFVTGGGGLALLLGLLLLESAGVTPYLHAWLDAPRGFHEHRLYPLILGCMFVAVFTKSAQFPFHFWLPNAMSAPTPISAFLHSATMVKAGIYLLMRLHPLLGGTYLWMGPLVVIGGVTALWGAWCAMGPSDLKRVLAHTTLMGLGLLTLFLGGRSLPALLAATTFLLVHALYKAALFLAAGIIDHQTGTRRLDELGGLGRHLPWTAAATALASLSMAGFPLFFGFIGKEILYKGVLTEELFPHFATVAALVANAFMTAVSGYLIWRPFFGHRPEALDDTSEAPWQMLAGPLLLGGLCVLFGLIPGWVVATLIEPAVMSFHLTDDNIELALFHGINAPLLLSIATLILGGLFLWQRERLRRLLTAIHRLLPISGEGAYAIILAAVQRSAAGAALPFDRGRPQTHAAVVLFTGWLAVAAVWLFSGGRLPPLPATNPPLLESGIVAVVVVATGLVLFTRRSILAIAALGVVGAGAALIYLLMGAPDLALTQLLVETLTLVIITLVLIRLRKSKLTATPRSSGRYFKAGLALLLGATLTLLMLLVTGSELDRDVTHFFETYSYVAAHGRNIVNVILVDFRSFDTLGEIVVVVLAALGAVALLRRMKEQG